MDPSNLKREKPRSMRGPTDRSFRPPKSIFIPPPLRTMNRLASNTQGPGTDWLIGILANPEFSDVTVQAGPELREFKLHRAIICARSSFFKAACKENFQEGISRQVKLPEISADAFEKVVKWMYGGGYELPPDFKNIKIVEVYEAADYLGIVALKAEIVEKTTECFRSDIKRYLDPQGTDELNIKTPFKLMGDLAKSSGGGDFDMLSKPVREIVRFFRLSDDTIKSMANDGENRNLLNAMIIGAYHKLIFSHFCINCRVELEFERVDRCKSCNCSMK